MKTQPFTLLPLLYSAFLFDSAAAQAVAQQGNFGGNLYQIIDEDLSWNAAKDAAAAKVECGGVAGHLATISSAEEQDFIWSLYTNTTLTGRGPWIGLNDIDVEDTFVWVTNETVSYTNWQPSGPNGDGDCVHLLETTSPQGQWNDRGCGASDSVPAYVVEYDCGVAPSIDWSIEPSNAVDISFSQDRLTNEIILEYNAPDPSTEGVSYAVTKHTFADCGALVDQDEPVALDVTSTFSAGVLTVPIDVIQSEVANASDVYNATEKILSFCLKLQYFFNGVEATYHLTKVSFSFDFEEGFDDTSTVSVEQITFDEDTLDTAVLDYLAVPFTCNDSFGEVTPEATYGQGNSYSFCVKTTDSDQVYVEDILAVSISQAGGIALPAALQDPFTSHSCDSSQEICRITTILDQRWFGGGGTPGALTWSGTAVVAFGSPTRRGRQLRSVSFRELEEGKVTNTFEAKARLEAEVPESAGIIAKASLAIMAGAALVLGAVM